MAFCWVSSSLLESQPPRAARPGLRAALEHTDSCGEESGTALPFCLPGFPLKLPSESYLGHQVPSKVKAWTQNRRTSSYFETWHLISHLAIYMRLENALRLFANQGRLEPELV